MNTNYRYIDELASTNQMVKEMLKEDGLPEGFVLQTGFQTTGKGMGNNGWESAKGKNLLFSILLRPAHIAPEEQFLVSQIVALGILNALKNLRESEAGNSFFSVKWPNDIYWKDQKLGGILIENNWQGRAISTSIAGIGLNVNQTEFLSDAPNPVSLAMIFGNDFELKPLLDDILQQIDYNYRQLKPEVIRREYFSSLFRNKGYHNYMIHRNTFSACIIEVEPDGRLILEDTAGNRSGYYFKEVEFLI